MAHEYANPLGFEHATGRVAGQAVDRDIYAEAASYIYNTGKQQPEKQQANCTRTEREVLQDGLQCGESALDQRSGHLTHDTHLVFINRKGLRSLVDAARKQLATLPKPEPKFRVVASIAKNTGRITSSGGYTRTAAIDLASKWMAHGCYDSVAVEQVSA